ncbi:MAG: hypothetical protein ACOCVA_03830 [Prolixibacteraceae bacterium]
MAKSLVNTNAKFGTLPVFFTALSTILGAILFLRFGWAVGQVGFLGALGIIILGHVVTIPTVSRTDPQNLKEITGNYGIVESAGFDICILNTSYKSFGYKKEIHIWIRPEDYRNANLMILLGYIIIGHPDWKRGKIKIFALYPKESMEEKRKQLIELIKTGRLPISRSNVTMISYETGERKEVIKKYSSDADLTLIGFTSDMLKKVEELSGGYEDLGNILFVSANRVKAIN